MTSTHRTEAERLLDQATDNDGDIVCDDSLTTTILAAAQVHATLAANEDDAATVADMRDANTKLRRDLAEMRRIVAAHISDALTRRELYAWRAAREVTTELEHAGLNINGAVDERLEERGIDPKGAWVCPTDEVNPDTKTWTDLGGTVWDLTKTWVDRDGSRWTWTGRFDRGPKMKQAGTDFVTSFDAVLVFSSPLTADEGGAR